MSQVYNKAEPVIIEESESADVSLFFTRFKQKVRDLWAWVLLSSLICTSLVFTYLQYALPEYKIHASLLVQDDQKGSGFEDMSVLQDFGLLGGKSNVDNEAEILKSRVLMEQVVKRMNLSVAYAIDKKFTATQIFESRPVNIHFLHSNPRSANDRLDYSIEFSKKDQRQFVLSHDQKKVTAVLGDTIKLEEGRMVVQAGPGFSRWPQNRLLLVSILPFDKVVQDLMGTLLIEIPNKLVSVVYLTMNYTLPAKGSAILNTLVSEYLQSSVNDKNRIAQSTINFIDNRLALVSGELADVEKDIEGFRTINKVTDFSQQSRIMLENTSEYARQQTTQEVALSVVEGLEQFLKDNKDNSRVVPSSLVMQDPSFLAIIDRYNKAKLERDKMLMSLTPMHPSIQTLDTQLVNLRLELLSSISSIKKGILAGIGELKKRTSGFEKEIDKVPSRERVFLDISRQQAIKQELYIFLLKKKEETAISMSANIANARVIDSAKAEPLPFKPKKVVLFVAGLLAGMILPFAVSFGKDMLNTRLTAVREITSLTKAPILAEIGHREPGAQVVTGSSRDVVSEQIRAMRTNLQYLVPGKSQKAIMITSSMGGEGKTFLGINLCAVLALAGKKVVLVDLDLRKPKVAKEMNLKNYGFTNYILNDNNDWLEWMQPSGIHENFQVIGAGPIPPNPSELLLRPETATLIGDLKKHFDYVILDTPPAGLVTDAEIVASYADVTLYMIRHKFTFKEQIKVVDRFFNKKVFPRMNLVVNDVELKNRGYGYGYGNAYGGYGQSPDSKKKDRGNTVKS